MADNKIDFDKELLLKEYELNNRDHDRKENMAWLASTLYYTYCIAVIGFNISNKNIKKILNNLNYQQIFIMFIIIFVFNIIIFVCVLLFINYQFKNKKKSIENINSIQNFLLKNQIKDKGIQNYLNTFIYRINVYKSKDIPHIITYILLWLFFIIKNLILIVFFYNFFLI